MFLINYNYCQWLRPYTVMATMPERYKKPKIPTPIIFKNLLKGYFLLTVQIYHYLLKNQ